MSMKRISVLLALSSMLMLVLTPLAFSQCRTVVRGQYVTPPVVVTHDVITKPTIKAVAAIVELVTPVLPIYTVPPAYGALYVPPVTPPVVAAPAPAPVAAGVPAWATQLLGEVKQMRLEQAALGGRLDRLEGQPGKAATSPAAPMAPAEGPPQPGVEGREFVALAGTHCASCHEAGVAKRSGGGFTLLAEGKLAKLSAEQTGEIIRRVTLPEGDDRIMPPRAKLSAAERLKFVEVFIAGR